jgi:hypothetical protein
MELEEAKVEVVLNGAPVRDALRASSMLSYAEPPFGSATAEQPQRCALTTQLAALVTM